MQRELHLFGLFGHLVSANPSMNLNGELQAHTRDSSRSNDFNLGFWQLLHSLGEDS